MSSQIPDDLSLDKHDSSTADFYLGGLVREQLLAAVRWCGRSLCDCWQGCSLRFDFLVAMYRGTSLIRCAHSVQGLVPFLKFKKPFPSKDILPDTGEASRRRPLWRAQGWQATELNLANPKILSRGFRQASGCSQQCTRKIWNLISQPCTRKIWTQIIYISTRGSSRFGRGDEVKVCPAACYDRPWGFKQL